MVRVMLLGRATEGDLDNFLHVRRNPGDVLEGLTVFGLVELILGGPTERADFETFANTPTMSTEPAPECAARNGPEGVRVTSAGALDRVPRLAISVARAVPTTLLGATTLDRRGLQESNQWPLPCEFVPTYSFRPA